MKHLAFRLKSGQLLKEELEKRTADLPAGVLISVVGSLENVRLRMAGATPEDQKAQAFEGPFEIVSGTGTFSKDGCHVHLSVADQSGRVIGGHLKDGCRIGTTVEVVIGVLEDATFGRRLDGQTGFPELEIEDP